MKIQTFIKDLTKGLHQDVYDQLGMAVATCKALEIENKSITSDIETLRKELEASKVKVAPKVEVPQNALELAIKASWKGWEITMPNYLNKRKVGDKGISMSIGQMIRPEQFEVQKLRKKLRLSGDTYKQVSTTGTWMSKNFTWTDDKNLDKSGDYYQYPEETIVSTKGDCEDHAFVMASLLPNQVYVAYGFWDDGKQKFGHAWNLIVIDERLYHVDTVGDSVEIRADDQVHNFKPYFVITPDKAYQLKTGVDFGVIAKWE